ncbi:MAG: radical SAM protein [Thermoanaerobaculia bacterium]
MATLPPPTTPPERNVPASTVYGPVRSWRYGASLGVDLLYVDSICSFQCVYCQLGRIHRHTAERRVWVPTEKVLADFGASAWREADVIALSGNGEPTLAANLGEVLRAIKRISGKPVLVLTNATMLGDPEVRADLAEADEIACKLDATDDATLARVDRPVAGFDTATIADGIAALRRDYRGKLALQVMMLHGNLRDVTRLAGVINRLAPDEVQLNLPTRVVPVEWKVESRGDHRMAARSAARIARDREVCEALATELRALVRCPVIAPLV